MSPTYERWKYCGTTLPDGTRCGKIAEYECNCGAYHPDDIAGMADPPGPEALADHPRFMCAACLTRLEAAAAEAEAAAERLAELAGEAAPLIMLDEAHILAGREHLGELTAAQVRVLNPQTSPHLEPVERLVDGDLLVLDLTPAPRFPEGHFGPYVLDREGRLTDVNYHYRKYHGRPVPCMVAGRVIGPADNFPALDAATDAATHPQ